MTTGPTTPTTLSYTADHEWIDLAPGAAPPGTPVRIGITSVAVEALGDLVFIQLPEVGHTISAGVSCGEVESTKTVSDLIAPVSGRVVEVNTAAVDDPAVIGADPYGAGWLFAVQVSDLGDLMTAAEYAEQNGLTR
jgi:glycine cleavage system H protein